MRSDDRQKDGDQKDHKDHRLRFFEEPVGLKQCDRHRHADEEGRPESLQIEDSPLDAIRELLKALPHRDTANPVGELSEHFRQAG